MTKMWNEQDLIDDLRDFYRDTGIDNHRFEMFVQMRDSIWLPLAGRKTEFNLLLGRYNHRGGALDGKVWKFKTSPFGGLYCWLEEEE